MKIHAQARLKEVAAIKNREILFAASVLKGMDICDKMLRGLRSAPRGNVDRKLRVKWAKTYVTPFIDAAIPIVAKAIKKEKVDLDATKLTRAAVAYSAENWNIYSAGDHIPAWTSNPAIKKTVDNLEFIKYMKEPDLVVLCKQLRTDLIASNTEVNKRSFALSPRKTTPTTDE